MRTSLLALIRSSGRGLPRIPLFVPLSRYCFISTDKGYHRSDRGGYQYLSAVLSGTLAIALASATLVHSEEASVEIKPLLRRHTVQQHATEETGLWVTHNEGVYDLSSFVANHPGGKEKILLAGGKDLSEFWQQMPFQLHYKSPLVFELLEEYRIGTLHPDDVIPDQFQRYNWQRPSEKIYPTNRIYECIVIGAGLSGLQCAATLLQNCNDVITNEDVLILEASDYVGGRVKQVETFVAGIPIDVGAEFLHGSNTMLARNAVENGDDLKELFCWAHADGGPLPEPADNGGYGLYYLGGEGSENGRERLLRFDDKDEDFVRMNETLSGISSLNENNFDDNVSLHDYLTSLDFSAEMMSMADAGYSNTICTNSKELSLKQSIRWGRYWDEEEGEGGDLVFVDSFKNLIGRLKQDLQVQLDTPVLSICHPKSKDDIGLVKLIAADGTTYFTKNVVVTAPPPVISSKMKFYPPLHEDVNEALDSVTMHDVVKIFLKFSEPVWPKDLHGVIMAGKSDFLIPEVWFKDIDPKKVDETETAKGLAICYTTADFAKRISSLPKEKVLEKVLSQMDHVFSLIDRRHMSAHGNDALPLPSKKPSEVYLGGMFWDWNAQHHPFISGGYCSPRAGKKSESILRLAKPYSHTESCGNCKVEPKRVFFAGEATNECAGATAHAAMESGVRAAKFVSNNIHNDHSS